MKKMICYLLSVIMLFTVLAIPMAAQTASLGYSADLVKKVDLSEVPDIVSLAAANDLGFDTSAYMSGLKWKITNADGMKLFSKIVNCTGAGTGVTFSFSDKTVYLANDIDMKGVTDFAPIGNSSSEAGAGSAPGAPMFCGTFDGQGHSISNLVMTSNADGAVNVALFGTVMGGTVSNLIIDSSCSFSYTGTSLLARVGSLVALGHSWSGFCFGGAQNTDSANKDTYSTYMYSYKILNVRNDANVSSSSYAGGIVGVATANTNYTPYFKNCTNNGTVKGELGAGGIVGYMTNRHITIESCANTGNVSSVYGGAAGILNNIEKDKKSVVIKNCVISGTIQGITAEAIAIVGNAESLNVADCDATGATVKIAEASDYRGYGADPLDYGSEVIGFDPTAIAKKDLSNVLPICTFLDAPADTTEFKISTPTDLLKLAEVVNAGVNLDGVTIYLENDLDMTGFSMKPIGSPLSGIFTNKDQVNHFSGTFDGQGHVIDHLVIHSTAKGTGDVNERAVVGLFGVLRSATVKNVILGSGCSFSYQGSVGAYVAAIAGMNYRKSGGTDVLNGSIENCYTAATVTGPRSTAGIVAAIEGNNNNVPGAVIKNCTNAGTITSEEYAGGIVAYIFDRKLSILNCRNVGTVRLNTTEQSESKGAAGICARPNASKPVAITNCINNGLIKGPGTLGGIVAIESNVAVAVSSCTNAGTFEHPSTAKNVGPIYGLNSIDQYIQLKNNADQTGLTDATYTPYTVTTDFPASYSELDEAHKLLFAEPEQPEQPAEPSDPEPPVTTAEPQTPEVTQTTGTETAGADSAKQESGCASSFTGTFALLLMIGTAGVFLARKKD